MSAMDEISASGVVLHYFRVTNRGWALTLSADFVGTVRAGDKLRRDGENHVDTEISVLGVDYIDFKRIPPKENTPIAIGVLINEIAENIVESFISERVIFHRSQDSET